ncbi:hypothetical protein G6N74_03605 [Mesorhizobium sp. CGMCC 1.15528]|uniref:Uncharacterized protein n=1 Tax=Mesorhizobium zhangyense TaxID=1776730 RepID=A0A7C9R4T1_9HYPH|nr:hypothetical protein [Mesorhizobium zhangyense]NGN40141.1 hypothetical protein [Mesorhizobium zhangyense]
MTTHLPLTAEFCASFDFGAHPTPEQYAPSVQVAGSDQFRLAARAYGLLHRSRDELAKTFETIDGADGLLDLADQLATSIAAATKLSEMLKVAHCRIVAAASYAEVNWRLAE